jgi:anthranilate/para-aminobenzoate synthase component II
MVLMIDNYDSFTYNLVQYLGELGEDVRVYRNDEITLEQIEALHPTKIVISPGPCTPNEAGVSVPVVASNGRPDCAFMMGLTCTPKGKSTTELKTKLCRISSLDRLQSSFQLNWS